MVLNVLSDSDHQLKDGVCDPDVTSPDFPGHKPKNREVLRIGRRPLICVGMGLTVIAAVMTYTLVEKSIAAQSTLQDDAKGIEASLTAIPFLEKKPFNGIIAPENKNVVTEIKKPVDEQLQLPTQETSNSSPRNPYEDAEFQLWQQREQEKLQSEQAKRAEFKNALLAEETVYSTNSSNQSGGAKPQPLLQGSIEQDSDYSQPQKGFVNIPKESTDNYLSHTRVQAASPYELKAGTVIPSVLLGGVNSDLPGQIMAQVSQNVFDSATGEYLLIPQGAKLVGSYDHQLAQGQSRVFVVWQRLIYPDSSSVNLEKMPGTDGSGYAGFRDKFAFLADVPKCAHALSHHSRCAVVPAEV
jgi:type IV secretion system protein TrbI